MSSWSTYPLCDSHRLQSCIKYTKKRTAPDISENAVMYILPLYGELVFQWATKQEMMTFPSKV